MITINIAPKTGTVSPPLQQQEIDFRKIKIKDTISFTIGSIPNFSSDTISILKNHSFEFTDIKKCAERMFNMTERFASAKENSTKHKIFCFLKTTLITSVIVVGILGCLALASVGAEVATVFVGLAVYFISGGLGALYGTDAGVIFSCDLSYLLPIACIILGPVFPIYEAMRKIPVLKKKSTNAQKKFAKEFCHIVSVFKKNSPSLYKTLVKKKQGIEEDIIKLKGVIHANTLTSDLQKQSKTYENALTELDQARQFYAQFENIQM